MRKWLSRRMLLRLWTLHIWMHFWPIAIADLNPEIHFYWRLLFSSINICHSINSIFQVTVIFVILVIFFLGSYMVYLGVFEPMVRRQQPFIPYRRHDDDQDVGLNTFWFQDSDASVVQSDDDSDVRTFFPIQFSSPYPILLARKIFFGGGKNFWEGAIFAKWPYRAKFSQKWPSGRKFFPRKGPTLLIFSIFSWGSPTSYTRCNFSSLSLYQNIKIIYFFK